MEDLCPADGTETMMGGNSLGDVESGTTILTSPIMDLSTYADPALRAMIWCTHFTQSQESFDSIKVYIDNGNVQKLVIGFKGNLPAWQVINKKIKQFVPLTSTMRVKVVAFDNPNNVQFDSYEAAFDQFKIVETRSGFDFRIQFIDDSHKYPVKNGNSFLQPILPGKQNFNRAKAVGKAAKD